MKRSRSLAEALALIHPDRRPDPTLDGLVIADTSFRTDLSEYIDPFRNDGIFGDNSKRALRQSPMISRGDRAILAPRAIAATLPAVALLLPHLIAKPNRLRLQALDEDEREEDHA